MRGLWLGLGVVLWSAAAWAAKPAIVEVDTDKEGIEVWLDGARQGEAPWQAVVKPGRHRLELRSACLQTPPLTLALKSGETRTLTPAFTTRQGHVRIEAVTAANAPTEADVYLGERNLGRTPLEADLPLCTPRLEVMSAKEGLGAVNLQLDEKRPSTVVATLRRPLGGYVLPPDDSAVYQAYVPAASPRRGGTDALITIVQFSDFQCPFCAKAEPTLDALLARYGDKIRVVFRDFPMPFHHDAPRAARAARAAGLQGKYWEMHARLFADNRALSRPDILAHAVALGLDKDRFEKDLDAPALQSAIDADRRAALELGVDGVPCFFVNGRRLTGAQPLERFTALIDTLLPLAEKTGLRGEALYAAILHTRLGQGVEVPEPADASAASTPEAPEPASPSPPSP